MIIVVRHGRTEANASGLLLGRADPGLDDQGRRQAQAIASLVPPGARIISSPLRRASETAAALLESTRDGTGRTATLEIDERWIEMDYGEFDLTPVSEVPPQTWARWRSDSDFRPEGGESHNDLALRVGAALDELARSTDADRDVVVVSHVSPIKASVAWALGVGIEVSWRCFVAQASVTRIGVGGRGPSLRSFNEVHHLDD